jgi:hypothetical protein
MHIKGTRSITLTLGCFAIIVGSALRAADPKPVDFYGALENRPIEGLPAGPYGEWTEDQKSEAFKLIKLSCLRISIAGIMSLVREDASNDQRHEEIQTLAAACIAMHLPSDHPAKKEYQAVAIKHYNAAKAAGSTFPPPAF